MNWGSDEEKKSPLGRAGHSIKRTDQKRQCEDNGAHRVSGG